MMGRGAFSAATSALGPVGTAIGALNTAGNAYNSYQNYNDLSALGVKTGVLDVMGGVLGGRYGGTFTDALDKLDPTGSLTGSWGGPVHEALGHLDAPGEGSRSGHVEGPTPDGGPRQGGTGEVEGYKGMKNGGYTGAGPDGVVQPDRPANRFVHEGEVVLTAATVRHFGKAALMALNDKAHAALSGPSGALSTPTRMT
jgi:hypothetical protein